jgi:hypothetical protein
LVGKKEMLLPIEGQKMNPTETISTHHGLLFRAAPSISRSDNQDFDEELAIDPSVLQFQSSQLVFIPTPDDLDGELERSINLKPTLVSDLPDGDLWAKRFIVLALEVMSGVRPIAQMSRWCSRKVFTYLIENINLKKSIPKLGRLHIGKPTEECMEVVLLLHSPVRKRALLARFEALDGRWLCTCLQIL